MAGPEEILLKANLSPLPSSRSALPALLEAMALWQGRPVHAALVYLPSEQRHLQAFSGHDIATSCNVMRPFFLSLCGH